MRWRQAVLGLLAACSLLGGCRGTSAVDAKGAEGLRLPPGDWVGRCKLHSPPRDVSAPKRLAASVDDRAGVLSPATEAELTRELRAFHAETCHELAVVTLASLGERPIERVSLELSNGLGLGHAGFNNGVMLLVALSEHKARIEVGCGLEDVVSDAQAAEVMRARLLPAFRAGELEAGIRAGLAALMALTRQKLIPEPYRPEGCKTPG